MQKHPEIHPRGHEVMAEDPPTGDSQRKETPPGGGAPGAGLGGLVGPEDDWDQEASLAAFVAEVEANRKFGLIDPEDYYDPDDGYDLPDDYCGPDGPAAGRPEPEAAGLPRDMAAGPAAGRPEPDAGLLPGAWMAAGMMVVLIATAVRGSLRAEYGTRRCQGQAWLRLLMRPPVRAGAMGTPVTMS